MSPETKASHQQINYHHETEQDTTQLLLIRHGLTDWVGRRLPGWMPGIHLSEEGRQQAEALARRLASLPIEAIYASPLERAVETAEAIAAPHGLSVQLRENLGEVRIGEWTGRTIKELAEEEWLTIQFYPSGMNIPGGETMPEMQARVVAELDAIRKAHPGATVAVVSHADVIKAAVAHYVGLHLDLFQRLVVYPASLTAFQFSRFTPRLVLFNDSGTIDVLRRESQQGSSRQK
ncbi:MAG TPA: MSMEG_4193 family putative phosphomutase [Anaerolineae bacterium]|nr:MSMEG_4193 family putative phosphomutase [Anaerolineae bacterium]